VIAVTYYNIKDLTTNLSIRVIPTALEPIASGRLKVCCYMEVPDQDELLFLLSINGCRLTIGYFGVVKGGGVSSPSFLGRLGTGV
jgi:hypothetical protein